MKSSPSRLSPNKFFKVMGIADQEDFGFGQQVDQPAGLRKAGGRIKEEPQRGTKTAVKSLVQGIAENFIFS